MAQTNFTLKELQRKQGESAPQKVFTLSELQKKQDVASKLGANRIENVETKKLGFAEGIRTSFEERRKRLRAGEQRQIERKQTFGETVFQAAGETVGGAFDIVLEGLKAITPDKIGKAIKERASSIFPSFSESPIGKLLGLGAKKFEELSPRQQDNARAAIELTVALAPTTKFFSRTKGFLSKGAEKLETSVATKATAQKQDFVRELIRPTQTKKVKETQVPRTDETGTGPFKKSIIEPTKSELRAETEVLKIETIKEGQTFQQSYNIIRDTNVQKAKDLKVKIKENDVLIPRQETSAALARAKERLGEQPLLVGDAQKTAQKLLKGAERIIAEHPGTASGLHDARIAYDAWVTTQKPKVFDAASESAITIANREIRTTMNDLLDSKLTDVATKAARAEQSALFDALNTIQVKAAQEADTAFLRALDRVGKVLGTKNKIVQGIAAGMGITSLAALQAFAPTVALVGGLGLLTVAGGKMLISPTARKVYAELLKAIDEALPQITDKSIKAILLQDQEFIENLLKNQPPSE